MARTGGPAGPTLATVAREARVSVPTASKVVNGREDVAPETRRRVTEALDRLGYVRRPRAGGAAYPSSLVDLVLPALGSSWSGAVLHGVEAAAAEAGLEIVVSAGLTTPRGYGPGRGRLHRLAARGSAGALFSRAELTPSQYAWLEQHRIPFVLIDPLVAPPPGVAGVGADDRAGGRAATAHLLALGHRRIAFLGGPRHQLAPAARAAGHRAALTAGGVPRHPAYERHTTLAPADARREALALLALPEPPTAVHVCSDAMALAVYEAAAERGVRVPEELSVVGCDDLPESRWAAPALTTVRRPLSDMAGTALRLLVALMAADGTAALRTDLPTRLVVRASTAPPPGRAGTAPPPDRAGRLP
ncbi:LacI family DNA-binding transcriptional regulator [Streptomyces sp. NPDC093085]|uniref:LacI family DNA-binding transcriptional regulator n=1 Tax=Streptomyces sp. NPDC093085 TaxID=3155068 RepID=UPI003429B613